MSKIEPTVTTATSAVSSTGILSNLFGKKTGVRSVADILGTFHTVVEELKTAVTHHNDQQVQHKAQIAELQKAHDASGQEIAGAQAAIDNITALITPKAV